MLKTSGDAVRNLRTNFLWGTRWGVVFGATFSALATVVYLLDGAEVAAQLHFGLSQIVAFYTLGGLLVGAIVGLCRQVIMRPIGVAGVGLAAGIPLALGVRFLITMAPWTAKDTIFVVVFAATFGCGAAYILRSIFMSDS